MQQLAAEAGVDDFGMELDAVPAPRVVAHRGEW